MKTLKAILSESLDVANIKVGDTIRTKIGGQIPGIVTKIEGDKVYFDHANSTYQTIWSGAKGKPKQYVAHISNVVKEELQVESFSKDHIDTLKKAYSDLERIDPTSMTYKKLINLLNSLPQDKLKQLANANIKFISVLAKNRIKKPVTETIVKLESDKYRLLSHDGKNLGTFDSKEAAEKHEQEVQFFKHKNEDRCWKGYKPTPGVKPYEKGSCMKETEDIKEKLNIWKYNKITGNWTLQRDVSPETKDKWMEIFKKDEPNEYFVVSDKKPQKKPSEIKEAKYSQRTPWALIDTADNDRIIATGSDESVIKRSITTAHLPPLRVKDKSKLKIVKMKKIQQVGEILKEEAEYDGKKVTLNQPFRTPDGPKKFAVYVKNDKGNIVKVTFGDPNMEIKRDDPERRSNYRARHNCSDPGPKWKANYWSCKMWSDKPVSKILEGDYKIKNK